MKNSTTRISRIFALKALLLAAIFLTASANTFATATIDRTFGTDGTAILPPLGDSPRLPAFAIQNNDKIIIVGDILNNGTERDGVIVRLNPNGTPDMSFGDGGKVILPFTPRDDYLSAVAVQADGKIIVAGSISPTEGSTNTDFLIARLNENGSLDIGFGTGGVIIANQGSLDSFQALKIQPDGKIVAVGGTSDAGGRGAVFRFNQNGSYDESFGGGFVLIDRPVAINEIFTSLDFYADGRILIGGDSILGNGPGSRSGFVTLLETSGALVQSFGAGGFAGRLLYTGFAQVSVKVLPNGDFVAGGDDVLRFTSDGNTDFSFQIPGSNARFALLPNGNLIITRLAASGSSSRFSGIRVYNKNFQLVGLDEKQGTSASPFYGTIAVQSNGKILIGSLRLNGVTSLATRQVYVDNDWKADIAVYRPSNFTFYVTRTAFSQPPSSFTIPPSAGRQIIPERYPGSAINGEGFPTIQFGWYNYATSDTPGLFGIREQPTFYWGTVGDVPVGGDYDGDGGTDYTVFRPSNGTWYISQSSNNQFRAFQFGQAGDKLVPADYDYDGITDFAVFRPSNGVWYISRSSDNGFRAVRFGTGGDIPITGDFDGDGRADFTVFRPSSGVWYSLKTLEGFSAFQFGISSDEPVPGDYDGDGRHDIAVFRAGFWYINGSRDGLRSVQWGLPGDVPVTVRY